MKAIQRVLDSNRFILGAEVDSFEEAFASYCGTNYCISVANGTDALEIALRAVDVSHQDTVLLAANGGFYGSTAVHAIGAVPYYIDVDPVMLTISPAALQNYDGQPPKALIVTHLYGQVADMRAILAWANRKGVPVIEDCAQAHGATLSERRAGSMGLLGCYSFYPTKNLGALGDGGAVMTNDERLSVRVRQLRQYGWGKKYHNELAGGRNSRMDEIQAAILRTSLPLVDAWNARRREIAERYVAAFSNIPAESPTSLSDDYVAHLYVLRVKERKDFCQFLVQNGIGFDIHYPIPDHLQKAYLCPQMPGSLPATERACEEVVSIPCFPGMTNDEVQRVIDVISRWAERCSH